MIAYSSCDFTSRAPAGDARQWQRADVAIFESFEIQQLLEQS
jgi:hypothetical protein